jgi:hypothetical protein
MGSAPGARTLGTRAGNRVAASGNALAACELRLERAPNGLPVMAVVGASFTAGTGPGNAALSWAVLLAREDLRALHPGLVIVQAGHDDSGVPAPLERQRVGQAIDAIRARGAAGADRAAHRLRRAVRPDRGPVPGQ